MRYGIALLLLMVFGTSSLTGQTVSAAPPAQSSDAPAPGQSVLFLQPARTASLPLEPILPLPLPPSARGSSLGRYIGWGALLGASAGVLSSLVVLSLCEEYCDDNRAAGIALHVSVGTVAGAGAGALPHRQRR